MPLPQQVVEQLSRDSTKTPGWSSGIMLFGASIFLIVVVVYLGLIFGYKPYLNGQISSTKDQISKLSQQVSSSDQTKLVAYYSQISNLRQLMNNHVIFSQFLSWLGGHTEANVYYSSFSFTSGNQITLVAMAKTPADIAQQVGIFESASEVQGVSISNIASTVSGGGWTFNVVLTMSPSIFAWGSSAAPSVSSSTVATTTTP